MGCRVKPGNDEDWGPGAISLPPFQEGRLRSLASAACWAPIAPAFTAMIDDTDRLLGGGDLLRGGRQRRVP